MNKDQSNGKWKQLKGKAKKAWGKLTSDNAEKTEGSIDEIYGVIQEKVGNAKATIKEKLDKLWVNSSKRIEAAEKPDETGAEFPLTFKGMQYTI